MSDILDDLEQRILERAAIKLADWAGVQWVGASEEVRAICRAAARTILDENTAAEGRRILYGDPSATPPVGLLRA